MENDSGGDSETKEVQMGNYDDADEDHGNDDNYADVNPWVELTYQVQVLRELVLRECCFQFHLTWS